MSLQYQFNYPEMNKGRLKLDRLPEIASRLIIRANQQSLAEATLPIESDFLTIYSKMYAMLKTMQSCCWPPTNNRTMYHCNFWHQYPKKNYVFPRVPATGRHHKENFHIQGKARISGDVQPISLSIT